jgi:hypothetical protein
MSKKAGDFNPTINLQKGQGDVATSAKYILVCFGVNLKLKN